MNDHDFELLMERVTRIETRLSQLMTYLGASVKEPNGYGEFFKRFKAAFSGPGRNPGTRYSRNQERQ